MSEENVEAVPAEILTSPEEGVEAQPVVEETVVETPGE